MAGTSADGDWSSSSVKTTNTATKRKSLVTPATTLSPSTQLLPIGLQQADAYQDSITNKSKSRKRRKIKHRDGTFRAAGDESESDADSLSAVVSKDEPASKKRKQRKSIDRTFRAKTSDDESDDHMVIDKPKLKAKSKKKSVPALTPAVQNSPSQQLIQQLTSAARQISPQVAVKVEDPEPQVAAQLPAPKATSAAQNKPAAPSKKRRRADDNPFVHESVEASDEDDIAAPKPSASARKPSLYTEAQARRDAEEGAEVDDEPSPKKLKKELARGGSRREQRIRELLRKKGPSKAGWAAGEVKLWDRLVSRGVLPQLPEGWKMDFLSLDEPFFAKDGQDSSIKALKGTDFKASKAFRELTYLGAHIRDLMTLKRFPERSIAKSINAYKRWAYTDAGLNNASFTERVVIVGGQDPREVAARANQKLQKLALEHRMAYIEDHEIQTTHKKIQPEADPLPTPVTPSGSWFKFGSVSSSNSSQQGEQRSSWWKRLFGWSTSGDAMLRPVSSGTQSSSVESELTDLDARFELVEPVLPKDMGLLYGILICNSVVQVVTYEVAKAESPLRNMIICRFNEDLHDIWNSMAVAITICHAREEILESAQPDIISRHASDIFDEDL